KLIATHIGPSVTKFEVKPDASVKVSKIQGLSDNIKMELAARDIRIEAPIPGKNAVGIEIPNIESTMVKMKELMMGIPKDKEDKPLLFVLGKDLMGKNVYCQLDKMPHLLIAGQTGSGKSVCMNTIITSFLLRCSCDDVKLLLVDPKKVEFTPYHKIPHLLGPVISDPNKANNALKIVVNIMDERYDLFAQIGVRNISVYNEKVKNEGNAENGLKPLPYIVVIIDELADLMAVAGKEVELSIQRITQLARAAGIHLIVATQRPSTDVITGIIKANIPSRIAFNVSSGIDSRTIIDQVGAERLLGNGDMLYYPTGEPSPIRLQGVYVTDDEVARICEFVSAQRAPLYDDAFIRLEGVEGNDNTAVMAACDDPLYEEIKEYVVEVQKASASLLQRRFGIGYNRAARMMDVLEDKGIIGPQQGSKPREVYLKKEKEQ
ncbi:MAG: DNA translocase FtsK, partial [Erysipelotrichaceae bacterium]|nr:DNA translocase FtsK [Erysipelotrichaceae bacterium]